MDFGIHVLLASLFGFAVTILWLVIGWRAMRAHETLAQSHASIEADIKKIAQSLSKDTNEYPENPKKITDIDPSTLPKFTQ